MKNGSNKHGVAVDSLEISGFVDGEMGEEEDYRKYVSWEDCSNQTQITYLYDNHRYTESNQELLDDNYKEIKVEAGGIFDRIYFINESASEYLNVRIDYELHFVIEMAKKISSFSKKVNKNSFF